MSNAIDNRRAGMSLFAKTVILASELSLPMARARAAGDTAARWVGEPRKKHKPAGTKLARHARERRLGITRRGY